MILLKKITLNDFFSHKETTIEFSETEKLLLDGNSGSGKSSVIEAIIFCLYGRGRAQNASLVRRGAKKAVVTLELKDDVSTYEIERTISAKGRHTLAVKIDGTAHPSAGVKELQAWIEKDLIQASYLLFVNSVAYLQGGSDTFVTQTANKRKELLLEIVGAGNFDDYYERARTKLAEYTGEISSLNDKEETLEEARKDNSNKVALESVIKKGIADAQKKIEDLEKTKEGLLTQKASLEHTQKTITDTRKYLEELDQNIRHHSRLLENASQAKASLEEIEALERERNAIEGEITGLEAQLEPLEKAVEQAHDDKQKKLEKYAERPTIHDASPIIQHAEAQIKQLQETPDCPSADACPYMRDKNQNIQRAQEQITAAKKEEEESQKAYKKWEEEYNALPEGSLPEEHHAETRRVKGELEGKKKRKQELEISISKREALEREVAAAKDAETQITVLREKVSQTQKELDQLEKYSSTDEYARIDNLLNETTQGLEQIREQEKALNSQLNGIEEAKRSLERDAEQLEKVRERRHLVREQERKMQLLKEAFGSKGIKATVVDYILPSLEERINEVLSQMSDFMIRLDTQQEKSDGEGNKEGLFITIINENGEEMDFNLYSGGEKLKIVVAISEALASLQKCGFRMMDETFTGLDENSVESFSAVLEQLQQKFSQILCISHLRDIKDAFETKVSITKHNGVSSIAYER